MRTSKIFVTVDIVVHQPTLAGGKILLIQRKNPPFENQWALPGGFVDENENLPDAAQRELLEETSIRVQHVEQLKAFGKPGRDPRGHMVSVAFLARITDEHQKPEAADDAQDAQWFSVNHLPTLAFDHAEIINFALTKI
ncbi:NUDIX domain-containing protein [Flavobacterium caeni]|uniref:8-oxo-dGTP diphosphatase n=1 Tax=Flavobacterium caeni TaxID=490189 RepID=A0A1G5D3U9_9FLAO|nr:NUDIX hydrolase [Flavobacterium caeni]SCY09324.1 8-oxo-dGTP diphosphatase [Flavobacterium caeni]